MRQVLAAGLAAVLFGPIGASAGVAPESATAWLKSYEAAWETRDAGKAMALFAEDATYQEDPYKEAFAGRQAIHDYWAAVTENQSNIDFTSEVLAVTGHTAIAHWHAEFDQVSSRAHSTLDGIFVLEFADDGLVSKLNEWWHYAETPAP